MKKYSPYIMRRLAFKAFAPVIILLFLTGSALFVTVHRFAADFIADHIKDDLTRLAGEIYRIADDRFTEILKKGESGDEKKVMIKKALALTAVIDFMRESRIDGVVVENGKVLMATDSLPAGYRAVMESVDQENTVRRAKLGNKDLHLYHFQFEPWGWKIYILTAAEKYSILINRVLMAYAIIAATLLIATALLILFLNRNLNAPLLSIVESMHQGRKPEYKGIYEFEFLSDTFRRMIESLERDFAELKRAESALQESEERYRSLIELSSEAIYIHTGSKIVFANAMGAQILGAERPEELYGRAPIDFVHPDYRDAERQRIGHILQGEVSIPLPEELFIRLDGSSVPVEAAATPFTYHGEKAVLVVARDVSERKKMRRQDDLLKAQKLESLGVLAGGIAHDFNNILTGILANLSFVRLQIDPAHSIDKRLDECEKSALRASELTRLLLTFARGGEPIKKLISTDALLREAASFVLLGSNCRSVIEIADDLWCLEADSGQLSQVLHNLLINAIEAMPGGGVVTLRAANETLGNDNPHHLPPGDYVRINVEDHGCGIPQENLARIFDPYFSTKSKGTGLGLASLYSIVKKHGGTVEARSTVGEGSSFVVRIPASAGTWTEEETVKNCAESEGSGRILVMDDEEFIRDIVTEILRLKGYEVESCADGREAVERYRAAWGSDHPFAAVILDLTVPGGMGGKEAASHLLEIDPNAVLIVCSGYSSDPVIANYGQYGFSGAIAKPFNAGTLTGELERLIHLKS